MTAKNTRGTLAALAAATLLTACGTARYEAPPSNAYDRSVQVEVTNNNWMDMTVYAMRGSMRVRLGTVTTGSVERFDLPRSVNVQSGELRLVADPIGSQREYSSHPIVVEPGARITWSLENHLALSSFSVRARR